MEGIHLMDMLSFLMGKACGGSGGGSSVTVEALAATENKTYTAPEGKAYSPVTVNVPAGGGGLEYEEGTWTPSADTSHGSISFANQHTNAPCFYAVTDISNGLPAANSAVAITYYDMFQLTGTGIPYSSSSSRYSLIYYALTNSSQDIQYIGSGTSKNSDDPGATAASHPKWYCTNTELKPYGQSDTKYWRAGRSYKWIAVFAPES